MAQRGRKPLPPAEKAARGTDQPSRALHSVIDTTSPTLALTPPELPYEVALVWEEYVEAAVAHGARQCDADSFAEWCTMTANLRKARAAGGEVPPSSYIQQWRTLGELFGLAGPKSRVMPKDAAPQKSTNPFARNGRRE